MNDEIVRKQETYLRVHEFTTIYSSRIPANSLAATLFAQLGQISAGMEDASSQQSSGARASQEATVSKSLSREELIENVMRMCRTARGMRRSLPGLEDKFRSPGKLKDQELLALARAYAADALPLKDEFIKRGLPEDFLDDLNEAIEKFEQAIARQTQGTSAQVSATATVEDLAAEGMETLRELDPIIRNIFEDDPAALAAWESARHIERAPRRKRTDKPATEPTK